MNNCCDHCGERLHWEFTIGVDLGPVLTDYRHRSFCRPLWRKGNRFRVHTRGVRQP